MIRKILACVGERVDGGCLLVRNQDDYKAIDTPDEMMSLMNTNGQITDC